VEFFGTSDERIELVVIVFRAIAVFTGIVGFKNRDATTRAKYWPKWWIVTISFFFVLNLVFSLLSDRKQKCFFITQPIVIPTFIDRLRDVSTEYLSVVWFHKNHEVPLPISEFVVKIRISIYRGSICQIKFLQLEKPRQIFSLFWVF